MTYGNPWQSYRNVATNTAPPGQLVLMLYDGAIRFLNQALAAFENEDPLEFNQTVSNNIIRAQDIINELNLSLNMTAGGEFSATMRGLYSYFDRRLQESNIQKEETGLREVIQRLTVVRDAWAEMLSKEVGATHAEGRPSLEAHG
ncbi:MAG: flagellar export chaperone FliS [Verrucomicrobiales bacterium]|nr:flagellar export chaperone FliS [Verrucomicrobiales bacterium]